MSIKTVTTKEIKMQRVIDLQALLIAKQGENIVTLKKRLLLMSTLLDGAEAFISSAQKTQ